MKKETWKSVYAPREGALERRVQCTLSDLEEKRARRIMPRRAAVLAAAAAMLVSSGALAAGVIRSHRYDAKRLAQQALDETYGITHEMEAFFTCEMVETEDEIRVTYTPTDGYMERLGVYTVAVKGGEATASWSNDGRTLDENVWDASRLAEGMERRAAGEEWYEILAPEDAEDEISDEEAIAIAQEAVVCKYGADALPDAVKAQAESFYMTEEARTRSRVSFYTGDENAQTNWYCVDIWTDDASVSSCRCMLSAKLRTLPAGDLSAYEEAVREYVECGALEALSDAERYAAAERIRAAGLGEVLTEDYADPASVQVTRDAAVKAGVDALEARYGLHENVRTLFAQDAALVMQDGAAVWKITLKPAIDALEDGVLLDGDTSAAYTKHSTRMGTYEALVDAGDGEKADVNWSLDGASQDETASDTWGQLEAYDAQALTYLEEMLTQRAAIYEKYGEERWNISVEDSAALDELMRAGGFSASRYSHVLPGEGELTQEQAIGQAKEALITDAGLTAAAFDCVQDTLLACYREEGRTLWSVTFYLGGDASGIYCVDIDALSGAIEEVFVDSGLAGNG